MFCFYASALSSLLYDLSAGLGLTSVLSGFSGYTLSTLLGFFPPHLSHFLLSQGSASQHGVLSVLIHS